MKIRIDGGRLLDLVDGSLTAASVLVDDESGRIAAIGDDLPSADRVVSLQGEVLLPGFIDVHVHLREPGFEDKETISSGARAAAAGGFSQILCMPNTKPPLDTPERITFVRHQAEAAGAAKVLPMGCITKGQAGGELTDFAALQAAGAVALSDDGHGVQHGGRMREALFHAARLGLPVAIHAEDESLSAGGVLALGAAHRLGLGGIPAAAEAAMIARDILLAEETGAHLHVCHVSVESAVALIRFAKQRGVRVTAEVTPHHLLLSDAVIDRDDAVYKVNPPLQSERDRQACLDGFLDGTLDMVATDHAPHTALEKAQPIADAPFGMVGIETVFPLLYTHLVLTGQMPLAELVRRMSTAPAQAFGLQGGVLRVGAAADLVAVNLERERPIEPGRFYSKGRNTPFAGWLVRGWPSLTLVDGRVVHADEEWVRIHTMG
ncbi:dihydroorotase [Alicyclobacillus shizuokensis]|uniref:dihydroorotase n=1 Tax=Alicyclobacillus shizuokensis TaxID=392014 RepID=UPI00082CC47E|nr:dihydroorotase [Alicyclobacillus shizuokensis]